MEKECYHKIVVPLQSVVKLMNIINYISHWCINNSSPEKADKIIKRERERERETERDRERERERDRQTEKKRERQRKRETDRQRDRDR